MQDVRANFYTNEGIVNSVNRVNFNVEKGEVVGLVGESGCGKSTLALSILRLIPKPGRIISGKILFEGKNLLTKTDNEMREIRGKEISMVFQDPITTLNPCYRIGWQIEEAIKLHRNIKSKKLHNKCIDMLGKVGISDAPFRLKQYPHHFSGGMCQRTVTAIAISHQPKLLILDEPTTALDVTIQMKILDLLQELQRELNMSILLISHNLSLVMERCNKVAVMYAGQIVEIANSIDIFRTQLHPYTYGLFQALPRLTYQKDRLYSIKGEVPDLIDPPEGCLFAPRCSKAKKICKEQEPGMVEFRPGHYCKCHFPGILGNREKFYSNG